MRDSASTPDIQYVGLLTCKGKQAAAWSTFNIQLPIRRFR